MVFHIQHQEGVHIYMHDTNIADGVEGFDVATILHVYTTSGEKMFHTCSMTPVYYHPGVGTIVQPTWWVQCTHVHGHKHGPLKYEATNLSTHLLVCIKMYINKGEEEE